MAIPGAFPESPDEDETLELVGRLKVGENEAWEELYRRYHDQLLFSIRAHLGPKLRGRLESEDVLQSVALDAFRALERFEPRHPGALRAYLHRMVIHKIHQRAAYHGAAKRDGDVPLTPSVSETAAGADGPPSYLDGERYERLERALAALPAEMARVVVLRKVDGCTTAEAAAALGKSEEAARKLLSRAMARLASSLAE